MTGLNFIVTPSRTLRGRLRVPGDKSISHRAAMLGALAHGVTQIEGFLEGEDCLSTLSAFRAMGVSIQGPEAGRVTIHGVGLRGLKAPTAPLDMGNSGTSMRLMAGILAAQPFATVLTGDASLIRRPMGRITAPLETMGARIETSPGGTAPLHIRGGQTLRGIDYALPMASAQVKSCVLLAGLYAQGRTCIGEPAPSRDHTERMLEGFGYPVTCEQGRICLDGGAGLQACAINVPADISSAAFFLVGASIAKDAELMLEHVGLNPTRIGILAILKSMGADIRILNEGLAGGEPVADLRVRSARLRGVHIPEALVPLAIDEFPAVFIAAACAQGETVLTGAGELRFKESDRIQAMAAGLRTLGIDAQPLADGMVIRGGTPSGGEIDSHGDHRIAMAFAMAGLAAGGTIRILDCANVNTSFPGFSRVSHSLGLNIDHESG